MSKQTSVLILGIFVAILPFLGFPQSWRIVMFVIAGICIAILAFMLRADHLRREAELHIRPKSDALPKVQ
jgi:hypothetical protein